MVTAGSTIGTGDGVKVVVGDRVLVGLAIAVRVGSIGVVEGVAFVSTVNATGFWLLAAQPTI
jgi:hypothetical protein